MLRSFIVKVSVLGYFPLRNIIYNKYMPTLHAMYNVIVHVWCADLKLSIFNY